MTYCFTFSANIFQSIMLRLLNENSFLEEELFFGEKESDCAYILLPKIDRFLLFCFFAFKISLLVGFDVDLSLLLIFESLSLFNSLSFAVLIWRLNALPISRISAGTE
jgi:hypothetical protein